MFFKKPVNTPSKHWYTGIVLILLSIGLLLLSAGLIKGRVAFIEKASVATGVVLEKNYSGKSHVDIRFTTQDGQVIQYAQNGGSYHIGDEVKVLYIPQDPENQRSTDAFGALWGVVRMVVLAGVFLLALGILAIFRPQYIYINGDK